VGAVFNRDYPVNRGWKPLPPIIQYCLYDIEFYEVLFEVSVARRGRVLNPGTFEKLKQALTE